MIKKTLWVLALFAFANSLALSTPPVPSKPLPAPKFSARPQKSEPLSREKDERKRRRESQIVEMDLLGNGKKEKVEIKIETTDSMEGNGGYYSTINLFRLQPSGGKKKMWYCDFDEVVGIDVEVGCLDSRKPKKSFLVLNCWMGATVGRLHIFKWESNTFREVENGGIGCSGTIKKMTDGKNAIVIEIRAFIDDETPNLYIYKNGFILPANYDYPEYYQGRTEEALNAFNEAGDFSSFKIETAIRRLMDFIYAGRVEEGVRLYNRIWKLYERTSKKSGNDEALSGDTALFRAYAYLEMGREAAGLEALHRYASNEKSFDYRLGDYYYIKHDFKKALKCYRRCSVYDENRLSKMISNKEKSKTGNPAMDLAVEGHIKELKELKRRLAAGKKRLPNLWDIRIKLLEKILMISPKAKDN